ncbi:hypothetical protein [Lacinutrix chionoecetis]
MKKIIGILVIFLNLVACGQPSSSKSNTEKMDLTAITNKNVKGAIEALQSGDKSWYSYFTENPEMTDDGNTKDLHKFFNNALGKEKFLSIDKVENEGKNITGNFKAGMWGTFKVYFNFHENTDGKFSKLDIGQTSKL